MKQLKAAYSFVFLVIILICSACISERVESTVPSTKTPESLLATHLKKPDIRGTITNVFITNERPNAIFVEGTLGGDTNYDLATVRLVSETRIFMQRGDQYEIVPSEQLTVGIKVEVVFTGTILERYPVSAIADEIVIVP